MSNVVKFGKPDPLIWVCACGCSTHRLYTTGAVECASCGDVASVSGGEWVKELPEPPAEPRDTLPETRVISLAGSPAAALQNMMRRVNPDELVARIAIMENGRVRSWGGIDTQERVEWLDRRLADARDLLTMLAPKSED